MRLDDYQKQATIVGATEDYMNDGDQQIKLQACTENLMEKDCTYNNISPVTLSSRIVKCCGNRVGSTFADIKSSARHPIGFP